MLLFHVSRAIDFVQIWPITQKFNSCVTDRRRDRRTDTPFYRDARTHLKIQAEKQGLLDLQSSP